MSKRFLFVTDTLEDNGYSVLTADTLETAAQQMQEKMFSPCVWMNGAEILEEYKSQWIIRQGETIIVFNPRLNTKYIVCMDDSKSCGHRTFDDRLNNVEAARDYINWIVRPKTAKQ